MGDDFGFGGVDDVVVFCLFLVIGEEISVDKFDVGGGCDEIV